MRKAILRYISTPLPVDGVSTAHLRKNIISITNIVSSFVIEFLSQLLA